MINGRGVGVGAGPGAGMGFSAIMRVFVLSVVPVRGMAQGGVTNSLTEALNATVPALFTATLENPVNRISFDVTEEADWPDHATGFTKAAFADAAASEAVESRMRRPKFTIEMSLGRHQPDKRKILQDSHPTPWI